MGTYIYTQGVHVVQLKLTQHCKPVVVQSLSHAHPFVAPWTAAGRAFQPVSVSQSSLEFMSIELVMLSNHPILCHPLLFYPQSFSASRSFPISRPFASGGQSIGASATVLNEYSGLISFRIDWFDLLAI